MIWDKIKSFLMRGSMNTFFIVLLFCYVKCDKERTVQFFPVDSGRKTMSVTYWSVCLSNTSIKINISGPHLLTLPLNLLWINLQYWISVLLILSTSTLTSYCVLPLPGTQPENSSKSLSENKGTGRNYSNWSFDKSFWMALLQLCQ